MNFAIIQGDNGIPEMSWEKSEDISTSLYLSLGISHGTLFNNIDFGLKLDDIKKVTVNNIELIKSRIENALQWMLDIGKVKTIDIIVERDSKDINRIDIKVEAVQIDGTPINISMFRTVGGPADGFTI